jgi:hypothetical protein
LSAHALQLSPAALRLCRHLECDPPSSFLDPRSAPGKRTFVCTATAVNAASNATAHAISLGEVIVIDHPG